MTSCKQTYLYDIMFDGTSAKLPVELQQSFTPFMKDRAFMATSNLDNAITLFPMNEWDNILLVIENLPSVNSHVRHIQKYMIGNATRVEQNSFGEINFPPHLLEIAKIRKNAVAIIINNKIELWNPGLLDQFLSVSPKLNREQLSGMLHKKPQDTKETLLNCLYSGVNVPPSDQ